jgi:hypothetical protein
MLGAAVVAQQRTGCEWLSRDYSDIVFLCLRHDAGANSHFRLVDFYLYGSNAWVPETERCVLNHPATYAILDPLADKDAKGSTVSDRDE